MRTIPLASFVLATLVLSGCGKKDSAGSSAAAGSAATSAPAAGSVKARTPVSAADRKACALMTKDEAAKFIGHAVQDAEGAPGALGVPTCRYKLDNGAGQVSVQFHELGETFDDVKAALVNNPTPIAGAGTKAVRNPDGSLLLVQANGHMGVVIAMAVGDAGPSAARADAFAPVLAGRL